MSLYFREVLSGANERSRNQKLSDKWIDYGVEQIHAKSSIFKYESVNMTHIGVTSERDFYLRAAYATTKDFFGFNFKEQYNRAPTLNEIAIFLQTMYSRAGDYKRAVNDLGI